MKHSAWRARGNVMAFLLLAALLSGALHAGCTPGYLNSGPSKSEESGPVLADTDEGVARERLEQYVLLVERSGFSYQVGDNPAIHRDLSQLAGLTEPQHDLPLPKAVHDDGPVPERWDAREEGIGLPPVRDQGTCGSCWAFSTIGPLEVAIALVDGRHEDLSEQYLLDCNRYGYGCGGGFVVHEMLQNPGAALESDYPYEGSGRGCRSGGLSYPYRVQSFGRVPGDVASVRSAIYRYGAVSVAMTVCGSIPGYVGGVYDSTECNYGSQNHAVVLVGWDDTVTHRMGRGVWIMRNSWGSSWGEGGYMRIAYGAARIAEEAYYVDYGPTPSPDPAPDPGPEPEPDPGPEPAPDPGDEGICLDTCPWAGDGACDDCGPDAAYCLCEYGTDCWDCGPRDGAAPAPAPEPVPDAGLCDDTCPWSWDGVCEDCGEGAAFCACDYGTDCSDCGPRDGFDPGPPAYEVCDDTCYWAWDGECDDCGPGAMYCVCPLGSDCSDCGPRAL